MTSETGTATTAPGFDVVDDVFRYRIRLRREGDTLIGEFDCDPGGGGVVEHVHPVTEERFDIREGEFTFSVDGQKRQATAGDRLVVAPGTRHAFVNSGSTLARAVVEMQPAAEMEGLFRETAALGAAG